METTFEHISFGKRLKNMLKVDFQRMFKTPLFYIMVGVSLALPILILVMTSFMGGTTVNPQTGVEETVETFKNVWQAFGGLSTSSMMAMDLTGMCNINMLYFLMAVLVCVFVGEDFRSGYAKNLFTVRSKKVDYVISKSTVCYLSCIFMLVFYFIGAMIGGGIAGLSFALEGFDVGNLIACLLSKLFLALVFVGIYLTLATVGKQRLWLSIIGSFAVGMLMFTMIPMITPLDSTFLNPILCLAGGALFSIGFGAISNLILNKTSLV